MSGSRRLLAKQLHSVSRRAARRCLFLLPSDHVNKVVLYALGRAQELHPVEIHALLVHSNHYHMVVSDNPRRSELSNFVGTFDGLVARALNAHYGRGENFWAPGSYHNSEIHDPDTLEEQLLYTWTQVVKDGISARTEDWPGVQFFPQDMGTVVTVRRPEAAFFGGRRPKGYEPTYPPVRDALKARRQRSLEARRKLERTRARRKAKRKRKPLGRGPGREARAKERAPHPQRVRCSLPDEVRIRITPPPGFEQLSLEDTRSHLQEILKERVKRIHAERVQAGLRRFMGVAAVLRQDPLSSAGDNFPTFARNPRIACVHSELCPSGKRA